MALVCREPSPEQYGAPGGIGGARRALMRVGGGGGGLKRIWRQSGGLERHRRKRRPQLESWRPCGAGTTNGRSFCSSMRRDELRARRGRRSAAALTWRRRLQNPFLRGGKARREGLEANGVESYLVRRLVRSPNVGLFCRGRRGSSGSWGCRRRLTSVWISSWGSSGARWMFGREF